MIFGKQNLPGVIIGQNNIAGSGLNRQSLSGSQMKLANAGAVVLPSNAQATRFAQLILDRL